MDLIATITEKLGISTDQAQGGVGMILKFLKERLGGEQYAKVEEAVPEANKLVETAEAAEEEEPGGGGLMGALGGVAKSFGGDKIGGLASLVAGFSKLGLSQEQIQKFTGVFFDFLKSKGADDATAAAEEALAE